MAQYSRMRDFALPAITSLKARLAVASREQNGRVLRKATSPGSSICRLRIHAENSAFNRVDGASTTLSTSYRKSW
jgi:hypothetical protein